MGWAGGNLWRCVALIFGEKGLWHDRIRDWAGRATAFTRAVETLAKSASGSTTWLRGDTSLSHLQQSTHHPLTLKLYPRSPLIALMSTSSPSWWGVPWCSMREPATLHPKPTYSEAHIERFEHAAAAEGAVKPQHPTICRGICLRVSTVLTRNFYYQVFPLFTLSTLSR